MLLSQFRKWLKTSFKALPKTMLLFNTKQYFRQKYFVTKLQL